MFVPFTISTVKITKSSWLNSLDGTGFNLGNNGTKVKLQVRLSG